MTDQELQVSTPAPPHPSPDLPKAGRGRVAAMVALSLLEVLRERDLPSEILGSEDPSQTMPRRLGLTEAVELQIRRYREEVRRRGRISDEEVRDLFGLVLRRPDSEEVLFQAGEMLAGKGVSSRGLRRVLPTRLRYALARRFIRRRLRSLFGRSIGGFAHGRFTLEARDHFFLEMDPGGEACALFSGFAQTILSRYLSFPVKVSHSLCEARKDALCRWVVTEPGD